MLGGFVGGEGFDIRGIAIALFSGWQSGCAGIAWRTAHLIEKNVAINALMYVESLCALAWLLILGIADMARIDYLVMGAAIIIGVNMAITLWVRR